MAVVVSPEEVAAEEEVAADRHAKYMIKLIVQSFNNKVMKKSITKEQYEFALERIEALLPLVEEHTPATDKNAVELTLMSDLVIEYEEEYHPIV